MTTLLKVLRFLGPIFLFFSMLVVLPSYMISYFYDIADNGLLIILLLSIFYSLVIRFTLRKQKFIYTPRDGFLITFVSWVLVSLIAALPFYSFGMSYVDSFFEAVSGLTTTGSTSISSLSELPNYLLMYRQLLQWAGGVGLVIVVLAIIPAVSGGVKVLQAETSGFAEKSFSPRLRETARSLLMFYLIITFLCVSAYWFVGMSLFDAFAHSFSTVSIGGFSTYDQNFGHFQNTGIELVAVGFMIISSTNFGLHFLAVTKFRFTSYLKNDEFIFFLIVLISAIVVSILLLLLKEGFALSDALRYGLFQTISIVTTSGFTLIPLDGFGQAVPFFIFIVAFIGACSGSVGGGMKAWRILILLRVAVDSITKLMHPNAVSTSKINGVKIESGQIESVFAFIAFYIAFFLFFLFILIFQDIDFYSAFSATTAAINNLGPGLGVFSENYSSLSDLGKYTLAFAMIVGRLELFGVLILFFPSFWKN